MLWGKENLCLIRPLGDGLALETLYYAEDICSREEIDQAVGETEVADPELDMARQLVASMVGEFDPEDYANEYRGELRAMLDACSRARRSPCPSRPSPRRSSTSWRRSRKASTGAEGQVRGHEGQEGACAQEARGVRFPLPLVRGRRRGPGRQVRLEEGLVDLALVDRNGLLVAHTDDLVALDPAPRRALRASGGWARSSPPSAQGAKKPAGRARAGTVRTLNCR